MKGTNEAGKKFFAALVEDADRKGTALTDFFRRQFIESLITGASYVLVDFPRAAAQGGERARKKTRWGRRGRTWWITRADDVINWSLDERGNFEWVVIRTQTLKKDRVEDAEWRVETRWAYYDKQNFRIYVSTQDDWSGERGHSWWIEGTHGLAKLGQVPLFALRIPEGLWMLNRAGSLQLEHFNKSNALAWALTMGLFAMPVVYSDREWSQMVGESYYIQLAPEDKFGWTEPEGKVYQIAADNLTQLQEEIYRVCYLPQAGGSLDRGRAAVGLEQADGFFDHAGSAAGVWRCGEGSDRGGCCGRLRRRGRTGSRSA